MGDRTSIEWTRADDGTPGATWNPVTGCTKVSSGCEHCYAERVIERFQGKGEFATVKLHPERLAKPMHWRRPRRIFVNSMADLFHDDVPDDYIAQVWAVMASSATHTFMVLTKRHGRMRSLLSSGSFKEDVESHWIDLLRVGPSRAQVVPDGDGWPLPNVWLGVSAEDQNWATIRSHALRETPAAVRFLSLEPLLGPITIALNPSGAPGSCYDIDGGWWHAPGSCNHCLPGIDWVITGGESGPSARPMHPRWAGSLRDQALTAGVPFLFKQWGEWAPGSAPPGSARAEAVVAADNGEWLTPAHRLWEEKPHTDTENRRDWTVMHRAGKKTAGRELDGRVWDEYPRSGDKVPS